MKKIFTAIIATIIILISSGAVFAVRSDDMSTLEAREKQLRELRKKLYNRDSDSIKSNIKDIIPVNEGFDDEPNIYKKPHGDGASDSVKPNIKNIIPINEGLDDDESDIDKKPHGDSNGNLVKPNIKDAIPINDNI